MSNIFITFNFSLFSTNICRPDLIYVDLHKSQHRRQIFWRKIYDH